MKSPITGKEMILQEEPIVVHIKGEDRRILQKNYLCTNSGETFTTTEMDEVNLNRLYNEYEIVVL